MDSLILFLILQEKLWIFHLGWNPGPAFARQILYHRTTWEAHMSVRVTFLRLPWWFSWLGVCLQGGRPGFDPWLGKIRGRRKWLTHSSTLAWRIPWTERSQRVGHGWVTNTFTFRKCYAGQCFSLIFCLEIYPCLQMGYWSTLLFITAPLYVVLFIFALSIYMFQCWVHIYVCL